MTVSLEDESNIDIVIRAYKDTVPYELELFKKAHFVAESLGKAEQDILKGVKWIKEDKYPDEEIKQAVQHLRDECLI